MTKARIQGVSGIIFWREYILWNGRVKEKLINHLLTLTILRITILNPVKLKQGKISFNTEEAQHNFCL